MRLVAYLSIKRYQEGTTCRIEEEKIPDSKTYEKYEQNTRENTKKKSTATTLQGGLVHSLF